MKHGSQQFPKQILYLDTDIQFWAENMQKNCFTKQFVAQIVFIRRVGSKYLNKLKNS